MYRITPLGDNLPSPYELLFCCSNTKPRFFIPVCHRTTKSRHPENDQHLEQNQRRQEDQARFYTKKASHDRKPFQPGEPVNIYNTINKEWEPGTAVIRDQQEAELRTYTVHKGNKENRRTREHLKIRKHRRVAQPPTSHQRSTSKNQAMNPRTRTTRIYRHRMKHRANQHGAILINKGVNNPHLQESRPQCKLHAIGE